jgi:hypothetical protein
VAVDSRRRPRQGDGNKKLCNSEFGIQNQELQDHTFATNS